MSVVGVSLKYAHVERERRWLLPGVPGGLELLSTLTVTDRHLPGTRLRLRETVAADGAVVRKLGQKVRLGGGPDEIACTSVYLDDVEWALLSRHGGHLLRKERRQVLVDGVRVAVDVFAGHCVGLVLAEVDRGDGPFGGLPSGLDPVAEVTAEEAFTGAALAAASRAEVVATAAGYGVPLA